jgi:hypothetical protein
MITRESATSSICGAATLTIGLRSTKSGTSYDYLQADQGFGGVLKITPTDSLASSPAAFRLSVMVQVVAVGLLRGIVAQFDDQPPGCEFAPGAAVSVTS